MHHTCCFLPNAFHLRNDRDLLLLAPQKSGCLVLLRGCVDAASPRKCEESSHTLTRPRPGGKQGVGMGAGDTSPGLLASLGGTTAPLGTRGECGGPMGLPGLPGLICISLSSTLEFRPSWPL